MAWENFYKDRLNKRYFNHIKTNYSPFIEEIKESISLDDKVLEIGCGMANITKALRESKQANFLISDLSKAMLHLSMLNTNIEGFEYNILKDMPIKVDLIHSHGVLEHFEDREIKKIIENQLKVTKKLIHYVPSNKYITKSFGDERLLSKEEWKDICKPTEIKEFNNNHDLILIWK